MADTVVHITNWYDASQAHLMRGRRRCCHCHGYALPEDTYMVILLNNVWQLRQATEGDRKVLCVECAEARLEARTGRK